MVASGFFNEIPARDAVASLSHRRAANKCGKAILPSDSGTALGWKKTIVGSEAMARPPKETVFPSAYRQVVRTFSQARAVPP